jgi:hypothetical protein
MEAMQVYHLTIQEKGHSRRFVYEDRDEALTRFAGATAAGLDAKLDEVVRAGAPEADLERPAGGRDPGCERARVAQALSATHQWRVSTGTRVSPVLLRRDSNNPGPTETPAGDSPGLRISRSRA